MELIAERGSSKGYWSIHKFDTAEELFNLFREYDRKTDTFHGEPKAEEFTWLFLSTSGIHGSYGTIEDWTPENNTLTVLVVSPRIIRMHFANLVFEEEQLPILRRLVRETLAIVAQSQEGNT